MRLAGSLLTDNIVEDEPVADGDGDVGVAFEHDAPPSAANDRHTNSGRILVVISDMDKKLRPGRDAARECIGVKTRDL